MALLGLLAAGCEDLVLSRLGRDPGLSFDPGLRLDFGEVQVGDGKQLSLQVRNEGSKTVTLRTTPPAAPWTWDVYDGGRRVVEGEPVRLGPMGLATFTFTYVPTVEGNDAGEAVLVSDAGKRFAVVLEARALEDPLLCSPSVVDFGTVVVGDQRTAEVRCTNRASDPIRIEVPAVLDQVGDRFLVEVDPAEPVLEIGPHATRAIPVTFEADRDYGPVTATLQILHPVTGTPVVDPPGIVLRGESLPECVLSVGSVDGEGGSVDFGFVQPGGAAETTIRIENRYDRPVTIDAIRFRDDDRDPALTLVEEGTPHVLAPRGELAAVAYRRVAFRPTYPGEHAATLRVKATRAESTGSYPSDVDLELTGFGGGPILSCTPASIDFGVVAVGAPVTAKIVCVNLGVDLPTPKDDLKIADPTVGGDVFALHVVRPAPHEEPPPDEGPYELEVTYRPVSAGTDLDEVVIDAGPGGRARIPVLGEAVQLSDEEWCHAEAIPAALDFGLVAGARPRLAFEIRNPGDHPCHLQPIELSGKDRESFRLPGGAGAPRTLAPGERLKVQVEFDPGPVEDGGFAFRDEARASLGVSNPAAPRLDVPLRGVGGRSCLRLVPTAVDFTEGEERAVPPGAACGGPDRRVVLENACDGGRTVRAIVPAPGSDPALAVASSPAPAYLSPGQELSFLVDFRPTVAGVADGGIRIEAVSAAGPEEAVLLPLTGESRDDGRWVDLFPIERPRLDLLFVIASSSAMAGTDVQARLGELGGVLRTTLAEWNLDWHVGATSSDVAAPGTATCPSGAKNGGEGGRLVPLTGRRILEAPAASFEADFRSMVSAAQIRPCPVPERAFDAAVAAASPPLRDAPEDPRYPPENDGNLGFSRSAAHLAVVFFSTGDDASSRTAAAAHQDLGAALRPGGSFSVHAIAGETTACALPAGGWASTADRYRSLTHLSDTTIASICRPEDWPGLFDRVAELAFRARSRFRLSAPPDLAGGPGSAIEVVHVLPDGRRQPLVLDRDCTWFPATREIELRPLTQQSVVEAGGSLAIRYRPGCG